TVLAIAIGLALPDLTRPLGSFRVYAAARMVATDLRQMQQLGVNDGSGSGIYKVTFQPGTGSYSLQRNLQLLRRVALPNNVVIASAAFGSSSAPQVRFTGGSPAPIPGGGTVILKDTRHGVKRSVLVMGATGRVRVE
ncbi:hypothetical protein ACP3TI_11260, partial [Desulforudis sp. 1190]|uniref:hypothetical protein n=1 Tax=Desulforudis sp. 1190 TaxID=3416136 RepID=UPI003CEA8851